MNILWIIGQLLTFIFTITIGLYMFDTNPKREKIWKVTSIILVAVYFVFFTIRMIQIYDISRTI